MYPRVSQVVALPDYRLQLTFTDGDTGVFDCRHLLDFGVFQELRDPEYFRRVFVLQGTAAWPREQDICPDTIYLDAIKSATEQRRHHDTEAEVASPT